ncbi:MAG: hypothetical protein WBG71_12390 [Leeuwenhoekiella sp.]
MNNKPLQSNVFSDTVMDNLQNLTDMSMEFYSTMLNNVTGNNSQFSENVSQLGKNALQPLKSMFNSGDCCPPKEECPPHCLTTIHRQAMPGERIVVPFQVYNDCNTAKNYQIGVRSLTDQDGNPAPDQPHLNKHSIQLQPHAKERVLVVLDLGNFSTGNFSTEVVLREREYNQNICLNITVTDRSGPLVTPFEEKKYKLKWQSWKSHYYCEPKRDAKYARLTNNG